MYMYIVDVQFDNLSGLKWRHDTINNPEIIESNCGAMTLLNSVLETTAMVVKVTNLVK